VIASQHQPAALRPRFAGLDGATWLVSHSMGAPPHAAREALARGAAVALARPAGARIVVLQVVGPLAVTLSTSLAAMAPSYVDPAWDEEALTSARGYVAGLAARLQQTGIVAEGRAGYGHAVVETLAETADSVDADLVVMSKHALTGPARAMLGSVADAAVRTARHPVLLVRTETAGRLIEQGVADGHAS